MISQIPAPRQQFVEAVDRVSVDHSLQDVPQIGVGLDVVQLARRDERGDDRPTMSATVSSSLKKRRTGAGAAAGSPISAAVKRRSGCEFLALVLTAGRAEG